MSSPAQPGSNPKLRWKPALWVLAGIIATLLVVVVFQGQREKSAAPTPTPPPVTAEDLELRTKRTGWILEFTEFATLVGEHSSASNAIGDRVRASGKAWGEFLDEFEDLLEAYRDGAYAFAIDNNLPRFSEVREINDRILDFVESQLQEKELYVQYLEESRIDPRKIELFDEYNALRIKNNKEWEAIRDTANDLRNQWGL